MASKKNAEFKLYAPDAKKVTLAGDFNNWSSNSTKMKKDSKGTWKAKVMLKPGRHEYKFVVDGNWWNDPSCANNSPNAMGSLNSVANIK